MSEFKDVKMICPKCKNDTFRLESKLINLKRINADSLMWNSNEVCTKCGWRSKPDDVEEKKRRMLVTTKKEAKNIIFHNMGTYDRFP